MNCQQINKMLERYDEGELPHQISTQIESHLENCPSCQIKRQLVEKERLCLQGDADIPTLSANFTDMVMARITVAPHQSLPPLIPIWVEWTRRYPTLLGAAAVILLFIFPLIGQPDSPKEITLTKAPIVHKMAAINQSQNVPFTSESSPITEPDDEFGYRNDTSTPNNSERPSRSTQSKSLAGGGEATPTDQNAVAPRTMSMTAAERAETPPALVPTYIPSGYTLDKIEIGTDNKVVISYQSSDNRSSDPLIINITAQSDKQKIDKSLVKDINKDENTGEANTIAPIAKASLAVGSQIQTLYAGYTYLISTNIQLKSEELNDLVKSLEIRQPSQ